MLPLFADAQHLSCHYGAICTPVSAINLKEIPPTTTPVRILAVYETKSGVEGETLNGRLRVAIPVQSTLVQIEKCSS